LRSEGRTWIAVGDGLLREAAREAVDMFEADTEAAYARGHVRSVPLARIMPDWMAERSDVLTGGMVTLHRLPRGVDAWRRRIRRNLRKGSARAAP
jgi:hypothetical protein